MENLKVQQIIVYMVEAKKQTYGSLNYSTDDSRWIYAYLYDKMSMVDNKKFRLLARYKKHWMTSSSINLQQAFNTCGVCYPHTCHALEARVNGQQGGRDLPFLEPYLSRHQIPLVADYWISQIHFQRVVQVDPSKIYVHNIQMLSTPATKRNAKTWLEHMVLLLPSSNQYINNFTIYR